MIWVRQGGVEELDALSLQRIPFRTGNLSGELEFKWRMTSVRVSVGEDHRQVQAGRLGVRHLQPHRDRVDLPAAAGTARTVVRRSQRSHVRMRWTRDGRRTERATSVAPPGRILEAYRNRYVKNTVHQGS